MKAISIKEPWASMIASGQKTIETRTWNTKHRGDLLICVSLKPKSDVSGMAIAVVELYYCLPMLPSDRAGAKCDTYPKAKAWYIRNVRRIEPFPVKGKLSLYDVDDSLIKYQEN